MPSSPQLKSTLTLSPKATVVHLPASAARQIGSTMVELLVMAARQYDEIEQRDRTIAQRDLEIEALVAELQRVGESR